MQPRRILLVDDNPHVLAAVARFLAGSPAVEVVGLASSTREALALAVVVRPDVVVMDVAMPEVSGLEATRLLTAGPDAPRVVLTSLHDDPEYRLAAEAAGADGFLPKSGLGMQLVAMIQSLFE